MTNIQSLFHKIDDVRATVSNIKPDILLLTETWLSPSITNPLVHIPGYSIMRSDRPPPRRGGGSAVYIKNNLQFLSVNSVNHLDYINAVWIVFTELKIVLLCVYIPPDRSRACAVEINAHIVENFDLLLSVYPNYDTIICGDFNRLPCSFSNDLCVTNIVRSPTRGEAFLDLVFVSEEISSHFNVSVHGAIGNSDHCCVLAIPRCSLRHTSSIKRRIYDLRKSNVTLFVSEFEKINWHAFYQSTDSCEIKCNTFHEVMTAYVNMYIPQYTLSFTVRDKPWITPLVKLFIQRRWDAYRNRDFNAYHHWKQKAQDEIMKAKRQWSKRATTSAKNLWRVVHDVRGTKCADPLLKLCTQLGSVENAVEAINSSFNAVYVSNNSNDLVEVQDDDWNVCISPYDVMKLLDKTPINKAAGSDRIPTAIYKAVAAEIAGPLCHIFCLSVSERHFPSRWKHSHVNPIPKQGAFNLDNLRPISLLPLPGKLLEKIVLRDHVRRRMIQSFGHCQFGGRPGSSTTAALVKLIDDATSMLDKYEVGGVQLVSYDYTKAFDKLQHKVILSRLNEVNFPLGFQKFIASYLLNRTQATRVGDVVSSSNYVPSGVPQGSVLGPYLYCLVAATLSPVHPTTRMIKFIDDVTLCMPLLRNAPCQPVLDEHVNVLDWSRANSLIINKSKSKSLLVKKSRDCQPIALTDVEEVDELRVLGVILNKNLSWESHIDHILKSANKRMYGLRILKPLFLPQDLRTVYFSLMRSIFEYASPVFVCLPKCLDNKLERFQNRVHKLICSLPKDFRASNCACNAFPSLILRRQDAAIRLFNLAAKGDHILHSIMPARSARSHRLIQPVAATSRRLNSFVPFVCAILENTFIE
ncbi:MAG: reverse transcriptase domain-containing protein [Pseudomonadota bacterium]